MRVRFSRRAREDLFHIWAYIATENPEAADRVLDRIESACSRLRDNPKIGVERPKFGDGARLIVVDRWLVLYRLMQDTVQIVRVVHGARDLAQLAPTPPRKNR